MATRQVTEQDFRMPEFRDAKPEEYEFRVDGKLVRKDRWERGITRIVSIVGRSVREFEIDDVVEDVRNLVAGPRWPSQTMTLRIEVYFMPGDTPIIVAACGKISGSVMEDIEADLRANADDLFRQGAGDYLYEASYFPGQYGFEGRCELPPCWELDEIGFRAAEEGPKEPS